VGPQLGSQSGAGRLTIQARRSSSTFIATVLPTIHRLPHS
jgi:hypothetical protein